MSESTRWYLPDGSLAPERVPKKDGKGDRPYDLRDARKDSAVGSVSSILDCAANEGIVRYRVNQAVLAALTHPRRGEYEKGELNDKAFLALVDEDANAHRNAAADLGKAVHRVCQTGEFAGGPEDAIARPMLEFARNFAAEGEYGEAVHERAFVNASLGYAGTPDLLWPEAVADYKTGGSEKPVFYDRWPRQLAAYSMGALGKIVPGVIIWGSTLNPGTIGHKVYSIEEMKRGYEEFDCLRRFFLVSKGLV